MDQNDADYINSAIDNLKEKQEASITILKEKTTILSNTINNFNKSTGNLKRVEEEINNALKKINDLSNNIQKELNHTLLKEYQSELMTYLNTLITDTEIDLNVLINVVMFTKVGQIHPSTIPTNILFEKLIETEPKLPAGLFYPIQLKEENIHLILQISEIVCYLYNDNLVFIIKVPLTDYEIYELYKIIPIPQQKMLTTVMINPKKKFLIISKTRTKVALTDEVNTECKNIEKERICKPIPLTNPYTNPTCETDLFLQNKFQDCDVRTLQQDVEIWNKLEKHNSWLYAITRPTILSIKCKIFEDIKMVGIGILTLKNKNCIASTIYNTLIPDLELSSYYENKIRQKDLYEENCCTNDNLKYIVMLRPISPIKITNMNLNELASTAHKIEIINGKLGELLSRPYPVYHSSYVIYIVGTFIIIVILIVFTKCLKNGQLCIKLHIFNKWFNKKTKQEGPIVIYRKEILNRSEHKCKELVEPEGEYRFDL